MSAAATSSAQASDLGRTVRWLFVGGINGGWWCTRRTRLRRGCKASVCGRNASAEDASVARMRAVRELSLAAPLLVVGLALFFGGGPADGSVSWLGGLALLALLV